MSVGAWSDNANSVVRSHFKTFPSKIKLSVKHNTIVVSVPLEQEKKKNPVSGFVEVTMDVTCAEWPAAFRNVRLSSMFFVFSAGSKRDCHVVD